MLSSVPTAIRPRIYSADSVHCIASVGNVLVLNWRGEFPANAATIADAAHRYTVDRYPPKMQEFHEIPGQRLQVIEGCL